MPFSSSFWKGTCGLLPAPPLETPSSSSITSDCPGTKPPVVGLVSIASPPAGPPMLIVTGSCCGGGISPSSRKSAMFIRGGARV